MVLLIPVSSAASRGQFAPASVTAREIHIFQAVTPEAGGIGVCVSPSRHSGRWWGSMGVGEGQEGSKLNHGLTRALLLISFMM